MYKLLLKVLVLITVKCNLSDGVSRAQESGFSARQLGQSMAQCFGDSELINCFENKIFEALDQAIANNDTWRVSDYLVVEKNHSNEQNITKQQAQQVPLNDQLALKILQLAQTRSLKIQLPSSSVNRLFNKRSSYSALADFMPNGHNVGAEDDAGVTVVTGLTGVTGVQGQQLAQEEGRRHKHKDKNMAMMGGMAMLAMVAQMFLGKVILIAGAAFVMAKVALLISTLGSLKKGSTASVAGKDHIVVTGGGSAVSGDHSHEHISSWQRRTPFEHNIYHTISPTEHQLVEPIKYFEFADKKRHPYKKPPK